MKTAEEILKTYPRFVGDGDYDEVHIISAMEEYASQPRWISVKDKLPVKWCRVIVCRKGGKIQFEVWNGSGWAYNQNDIQYWMPMPEPPKQEGVK